MASSNVFCDFPFHLCKVLRLPRKNDARSYEVLHLSRKIILANLKIWCSKMQPPSGNQRPDLLTSLINMSLVLRLPREMHLCRSSANVPRLPSFLDMLQNPHVLLTFGMVQNPLHLPRKTTSEPSKVVRACGVFNIWLGNVLRATTACTFSKSQRPKVVRACGVFKILTWKCASRHNGVQFFISHLPRRLCIAPVASLLLFSSLLFSSLTLPTSAFSSVHIVGSLTSKLPSVIISANYHNLIL